MLAKAGAFRKVMDTMAPPVPNMMARRTDKSSSHRRSVFTKETPYVQEVYRQIDGEDNAYEQTYMRAQTEVVYIDVD